MTTRPRLRLAKLTRPRLHAAYARERLFERLDAMGHAAVVWITGPPGAGKSTLAATWLEARRRPSIWYQLDPGDGDPATFFYYLRQAAEAAGAPRSAPLPLLAAEYQGDVPGFARRWFRALFSALPTGAVLALDHYEELAAGSILHRGLADACEEIPEGAQLVVMSRADTPPELARVVASERLARIGPDDLRLTEEEAAGIASGKDALTAEEVRELYARCAGWAAGFTLLRARTRQTGRVNHVDERATMQEVFDYFMEQVFRDLSETGRAALVTTSVLPRFTEGMARELTGDTGIGELLDALYRRHLFVERRYGDEITYQYHPLFRGFLLDQARRGQPPEARADLAHRAAALLERSGAVEDALQLLLDVHDHGEAARILEALAPRLVAAGRGASYREWIARLPDADIGARPHLSYWLGNSLMGISTPGARAGYERAHEGFVRTGDRTGQAMAVAGLLHAYLHGRDDDASPTLRWLDRVDALFGDDPGFPSPAVAARAYGTLVGILWWMSASHPLLPRCVHRLEALLAEPLDDDVKLTAGSQLVEFYAASGFLHEADRVIAATEPLARTSASPMAWTYWLLRSSRRDWAGGDLVAARAKVERALANAVEQGRGPGGFIAAVMLADLSLDMGEPSSVPALIERAPSLLPAYLPATAGPKNGRSALEYMRGKHAACVGDLDGAVRHLEQARALLSPALQFIHFNYSIGLAALRIERGELARARAELDGIASVYGPELFPTPAFQHAALRAVVAAAGGDASHATALREPLRHLQALGVAHPFTTQRLAARQVAELLVRHRVELPYVCDWIRRGRLLPSAPDVPDWPWPLAIRTLGRFEVVRDGAPLRFTRKVPRKPLELLQAIVAFGGKDVRGETLCDALWPESDGDTAAGALRMTISRLRRVLQRDAVVQQDGRVSLDPRQCWVDLWAFRSACDAVEAGAPDAATQAIGLVRGAFLQDERDAPWLLAARDRTRRQLADTLSTAGSALERMGRADAGARLRTEALRRDPGLAGRHVRP